MSSNQETGSDGSPTQTTSNDARARDPKDTGEIDAEVIEETPAAKPPPRVARPADVRPLSSVGGDVFGGDVSDTSNAKRERTPPSGEPAPKKKRGKGKAQAEPVDVDAHRETAKGFVVTADALFRGWAKSRYSAVLDENSLRQLDAQLALTEPQADALADPLARGLAESGVEIPWWGQLALAAGAMYVPKLGALAQLDRMKEEHDKREAAKVAEAQRGA